jgi:DNA-binding GntR family transcriptional regulator
MKDGAISSRDGKGTLINSRDAERLPTKDRVISRVAEVAREIGNSHTVEIMSTKDPVMSREAEMARETLETRELWKKRRRTG